MTIDRYPYRARVWWDGRIVAQSDRCLCDQTLGALPVLYFPLDDVDLDREVVVVSGSEGLADCLRPPGPHSEPAGHVAFDHDRVRIEVTDEAAGDDARAVTVKRFPTWGDAARLVDVMDVRPVDDDGLSFFGVARSDG
jgi:acyl-CoA thioesterase II